MLVLGALSPWLRSRSASTVLEELGGCSPKLPYKAMMLSLWPLMILSSPLTTWSSVLQLPFYSVLTGSRHLIIRILSLCCAHFFTFSAYVCSGLVTFQYIFQCFILSFLCWMVETSHPRISNLRLQIILSCL